MRPAADVVVIGSGGFGAATAYFLARRGGARRVVVMTCLARRAVEWLLRFGRDTGQPLEIVQSGSLKAARRREDATTLDQEAARGQQLGLGTRIVSPEDAHRMHAFFQPTGDLGAMSIARFGSEWHDERRLREAAAWEYWHFYSYQTRKE